MRLAVQKLRQYTQARDSSSNEQDFIEIILLNKATKFCLGKPKMRFLINLWQMW
jgi:hypothetical protein